MLSDGLVKDIVGADAGSLVKIMQIEKMKSYIILSLRLDRSKLMLRQKLKKELILIMTKNLIQNTLKKDKKLL